MRLLSLSAPIELLCPAKLNLSLRVTGKREDGYHDLETVFHRVTLFDRLRLSRKDSPGAELWCPDSGLPVDGNNIVLKAAEAFFKNQPETDGVTLTLWKKIPVAAGMGGGSSDAAATLAGLNRLFGRPYSLERLMEIGSSVGADVPFFLLEVSSAFGEGIGDRLKAIRLPLMWFVLVHPPLEVSTAWVYRNFDLSLTKIAGKIKKKNSDRGSFSLDDLFFNDLQKVTFTAHPELRTIRETLVSLGALKALMSGSGPTVFGVFPDMRAALAARRTITAGHGWKSSVARSF
jgi:4-diphosphocytidyl-2-C-methyl-D-erythritol kinase